MLSLYYLSIMNVFARKNNIFLELLKFFFSIEHIYKVEGKSRNMISILLIFNSNLYYLLN